ncbi:hypothetical protein ACFV6Y_39060 [Streptomyces massasporeus]
MYVAEMALDEAMAVEADLERQLVRANGPAVQQTRWDLADVRERIAELGG